MHFKFIEWKVLITFYERENEKTRCKISLVRNSAFHCLSRWFSTFIRWRHMFWKWKNLQKIYNIKTTVLYKQVPNYKYQKLKVKVYNYLATHQKKLAKYVATPWLRTTGLSKLNLAMQSVLTKINRYFKTWMQIFLETLETVYLAECGYQ
jgi:hypothetical protein